MRGLCKTSIVFLCFEIGALQLLLHERRYSNQHTQGLGVLWHFCLRGC